VTDASVELNGVLGRTSTSLLVRVKQKDPEAWRRLVQLYSPLVYQWCRRYGLQEADAADVGQDVFRTVAESIDRFQHGRSGDSFRGWLRAITRTRCLDFSRRNNRVPGAAGGSEAQARLLELPEPEDDSDVSLAQEKHLLVRRAVELVLESCKEETRQAFLRVVVEGQQAADVARDLGITTNAVYVAKSHLLRRIREEFAQIVDM
jgi:RNA polymerase sigma-70 factor (ECF subfamily)